MSPSDIIEEYKSLRNYLDVDIRLIIQVFTISVVVLVPFISGLAYYFFNFLNNPVNNTISFEKYYHYFFLSPFLIILPCAFLITSLRKDLFRIGAYIQVFLESKSQIKFETRLDEFRKEVKEESLDYIIWTYWAISFISLAFYLIAIDILVISFTVFNIGLAILLLLFLGFITYKYLKVPTEERKKYYSCWMKVKKETNNKLDD